jgi:signal peptidase I
MKLKEKKVVEKIINILLNFFIFIFGVILLISIYTGVQTRILGNDHSDFFGYSLFEVQTGSMADTINAGDWIVVKLTNKVKLNDIITYKSDKNYITHRVIEAYNGTYVTKGDANNAKDEPIYQKQIVGKVVNTLAGFGILRKTLFNPSVLIALVIVLFLFNYALKKSIDEKNKKKKKEINFYSFLSTILEKLIEKIISLMNKLKKYLEAKKEANNAKEVKIIEEAIQENNEQDEEEQKLEENSDSLMDIEEEVKEETDPKPDNEIKLSDQMDFVDEDDLDKTTFYRVIPVDMSEIGDTFLEIAKNEIKESEKKNKENVIAVKVKQEEIKEEVTEDEETLTKINLEALKNKMGAKKSKNIVATVVHIKKEELNELINLLIQNDYKKHVNEATIKDVFVTSYIEAKYYNNYGSENVEYLGKKLVSKIEKVIKEVAKQLIKKNSNKNPKYVESIDFYVNAFKLIASLEQARDSIEETKIKEEFYKKEIANYCDTLDSESVEYICDEIIKIQKNHNLTLNYFLKKLETNMFELNLNKINAKKNIYGLELKHNISFSKVYSDYIVYKTYTEGIIAEDKMPILLTLLLVQITKDMLSFDFNKKYIIHMPVSLYGKEKKMNKLLGMLDDEYVKNNVVFLVSFNDLVANIQSIKKIRKTGYKFAIVFEKDTVLRKKDRGDMYIGDYMFINKKEVDKEKILPFIPQDIVGNVIYDNIIEKVGDFSGE